MAIDIKQELVEALKSEEVRQMFRAMIREAVRTEALADTPPDAYIDVKEAAALLGMSDVAVRKSAARGHLPHVKKGHRVMFKRVELIDLLESGRAPRSATGRHAA